MSQPSLHGGELIRALTDVAREVQKAHTVKGVVDAAGAGLERAGFWMGVLMVDSGIGRIRYLSRPGLDELARVLDALPPEVQISPAVEAALANQHPTFLPVPTGSLPAPLAKEVAAALQALPPMRVVILPLRLQGRPWGAIGVIHDGLMPEDLPALELFALQVGSALEVAEALERLASRTAELQLAHELAVAGPRSDATALCRRALAVVSGSTQSDGAALHRYDTTTRQFVLVADPHGEFIEAYRRFTPADHLGTRPVLLEVSALRDPSVKAAGYRWIAVIPLSIQGRRLGLLTLARRADLRYSEAEMHAAEILGVQVASLLERIRLYDDASRLYADLKHSYDELAHAQAELVRHERLAALGELAAVMAHEVRNPLGVIFNSLTTIKRLLRPTGDAEMLLNMVGEEADRLNRIVGDLLDFVRPYEVVRRPIAVEPIIASAIAAVSQALTLPSIEVVTEVPEPLPPFPLDAHLVRQALVNLLMNAIQAMPRGGKVTVRVVLEQSPAGPALVIEVHDQGTGLSPRAAERIFQPFFTTKATGTGLGLAVVKRIVDGHSGEVTAKVGEGGGTVFVIRLPSAELAGLTPAKDAPGPEAGPPA